MLELENITKLFGHVTAVHDVSLSVEQGEFFSLLGPSGCGKTTVLRLIAGIYSADRGRVILGGKAIDSRPMNARDTALVFQNYALFPHLSVFENIAFGLRMRKVAKREIAGKVNEALELVRMSGFAHRKPGELSGGQQQRVALARAIVVRPSLLLLDEPLSNLDAKLRDEMRDELRTLQRRLGITTVLVTHDLQEAFAVSDRIAVMREGRLSQMGTPSDLYNRPESRFVASFVGHVNIVPGRVSRVRGGQVTIENDDGFAVVVRAHDHSWTVGAPAWVTLRPERVNLMTDQDGPNIFDAEVDELTYLGNAITLRLRIKETVLRAHVQNTGQQLPRTGDAIRVGWSVDDLVARPEGPDDAG